MPCQADLSRYDSPQVPEMVVLPGECRGFWQNVTRRGIRQVAVDMQASQGQKYTKSLDAVAFALATWFGVGFLPGAPGTWASVSTIVIFVLFSCLDTGGQLLFEASASFLILLLFLGIWASGRSEKILGKKDDGRIVIDEVFGQSLALFPLTAHFAVSPLESFAWNANSVAAVVTAFVAFRCFDITKLGPVGWADRRVLGGLGVMLDDLIAGVMAAACVAAVLFAFQLVGEIY